MADAYRIATKVPWEKNPRDWSGKFNTLDGALHELRDRADEHRGNEFDERIRGKGDWGNDRILGETLDAVRHELTSAPFGEVAQVRAISDKVQWWVRKIKDKDPDDINKSEANDHVDAIYTWIFRDHRGDYPGIENWGTCNRRFIAGTTDWSQHAPWKSPDPGCNAIDVNASYTVMYNLSRDLAGKPHVAKILFYNHEWTPGTGWISASIGHYDHVHIEGPRNHGSLDSACHY